MSKNPHTGDEQKTKPPSNKYREGWDKIFGNKEVQDTLKKLGKEITKSKQCPPESLCRCDHCE